MDITNKEITKSLEDILLKKDNTLSLTGSLILCFMGISLMFGFIKNFRFIFKKKKHKKQNDTFLGLGCPYCNTLYLSNINRTNCKNCGASLEYVYLRKVGVNYDKITKEKN